MANDGRPESAQVEVGQKDLKLITEVALTTMSSTGLRATFQEYWNRPTAALFYTLSHCTFPLLEDVMKAIIEVAVDGPGELPKGLYSTESHSLQWLRRRMQEPTVFEAGEYRRFIADVNRKLRESGASPLSLARMQRDHSLLSGPSVFDNVITEADRVWPGWKYLEAGEKLRVDPALVPLAFDVTRWLLIEFLQYERAHKRVAASFPEMERYIAELLHVYD